MSSCQLALHWAARPRLQPSGAIGTLLPDLPPPATCPALALWFSLPCRSAQGSVQSHSQAPPPHPSLALFAPSAHPFSLQVSAGLQSTCQARPNPLSLPRPTLPPATFSPSCRSAQGRGQSTFT